MVMLIPTYAEPLHTVGAYSYCWPPPFPLTASGRWYVLAHYQISRLWEDTYAETWVDMEEE